MTIDFKAPFLPAEKIREEANKFLDRYHPQKTPPIPIEDIVELELKMIPHPIIELRRRTGIESMLMSDLKTLFYDNYLDNWNSYLNRRRFCFAHEAGHYWLHPKIVQEFNIADSSQIKNFIINIDRKQYGWIETHAYEFAGLILVPPNILEAEFKIVCENLKSEGYSPDKDYFIFGEYLIERLAKKFQVSNEVMEKRIQRDYLSME